MNEFNYCIGRYWNGKDGSISVYTYHTQVHYGTQEDANGFLEYVKSKSPEHDWKIFELKGLN
jgi:hypothetical protein